MTARRSPKFPQLTTPLCFRQMNSRPLRLPTPDQLEYPPPPTVCKIFKTLMMYNRIPIKILIPGGLDIKFLSRKYLAVLPFAAIIDLWLSRQSNFKELTREHRPLPAGSGTFVPTYQRTRPRPSVKITKVQYRVVVL